MLPGVLDDALLADWCLRYLGAPFKRVLFRSGFLSEVVRVELPGGLRAVVKARPFQPRIAGCLQVQAALARVGFHWHASGEGQQDRREIATEDNTALHQLFPAA